jgi:chorismate mutase
MEQKEIIEQVINDFRQCRARIVSPETGDRIFRKAMELSLETEDLKWLKQESKEAHAELAQGDESVILSH